MPFTVQEQCVGASISSINNSYWQQQLGVKIHVCVQKAAQAESDMLRKQRLLLHLPT